jgi:hypothetical protein
VSKRRITGGPAGLALMVALTVALAGCVSLPTSGVVRGANNLPESGGQPITMVPVPPGAGWQPQSIVGGFLAASGTVLSLARKYLTPTFAKQWQPDTSAPEVIDSNSEIAPFATSSHVTGGQATGQEPVISQHLEKLVSIGKDEPGRLMISSQSASYTFNFELTNTGGKWRIDGIDDETGKPDNKILLLTDADFQRAYQPRDLYFPYTAPGAPSPVLVPYPVYISDRAEQSGEQQLVNGLISPPQPGSNWLYGAVATAFPRGTKVNVAVHSNQAVVSLGGAANSASFSALSEMKEQLVWTLTNSPYVDVGIGSVELVMRHGSAFLLTSKFPDAAPPVAPAQFYYQRLDPQGNPQIEVVQPPGRGKPATAPPTQSPVLLPQGLGAGLFNAIAVSPSVRDGRPLTFAGCRGGFVYVAPMVVDSDLLKRKLPAPCSSLSWDNQGDLWATTGTLVEVLTETTTGLKITGKFTPVPVPPLQGADTSDTFTSLEFAPDGVRVAMIVRSKVGASVYVAAISRSKKLGVYLAQSSQLLRVGPDLTDPVALSWWDPDHLLVLDHHGAGSQLYKVPLDGGTSTPVPTPRGAVSVTANGTTAAIGTARQSDPAQVSVKTTLNLSGIWEQLANGSAPAYPG